MTLESGMTLPMTQPPATSPDFEAIKKKQQTTWASGDFAVIGTTLQIVGELLAEAADIRAGERVGLVGRSGSGKTTFVKLVQRLYDVSGGKILIDGQDIALATQQSLRSQIAIVQQEPILFHRTLAENIAYGRPGASRSGRAGPSRLRFHDLQKFGFARGYAAAGPGWMPRWRNRVAMSVRRCS